MKASTMQQCRKEIKRYLSSIGKGNQFYGITLTDYVMEKVRKPRIYPDTILRQLRLMRERGEINYQCQGDPSKSTYVLTKIN